MLEQARLLRDPTRVYVAAVSVEVPQSDAALAAGQSLEASIQPLPNAAALSFWEGYAVQTLEDRFPSLGLVGEPTRLPETLGNPGERVAVRLTAVDAEGPLGSIDLRPDDLLLAIGGEPFFQGRGFEDLRQWLIRDLETAPRRYSVETWRDGAVIEQDVMLQLRPFDE